MSALNGLSLLDVLSLIGFVYVWIGILFSWVKYDKLGLFEYDGKPFLLMLHTLDCMIFWPLILLAHWNGEYHE